MHSNEHGFQYTPTGWDGKYYLPELLASGEHLTSGEDFMSRFMSLQAVRAFWLNYITPFPDSKDSRYRKEGESKEKHVRLRGNINGHNDFDIRGNSFLMFVYLVEAFKADYEGAGKATTDLDVFVSETTRLYRAEEYMYETEDGVRIEAEHDTNFKFRFRTDGNGTWVKVSMPSAFKNEQYFSF